jgi:hypothetical protein
MYSEQTPETFLKNLSVKRDDKQKLTYVGSKLLNPRAGEQMIILSKDSNSTPKYPSDGYEFQTFDKQPKMKIPTKMLEVMVPGEPLDEEVKAVISRLPHTGPPFPLKMYFAEVRDESRMSYNLGAVLVDDPTEKAFFLKYTLEQQDIQDGCFHSRTLARTIKIPMTAEKEAVPDARERMKQHIKEYETQQSDPASYCEVGFSDLDTTITRPQVIIPGARYVTFKDITYENGVPLKDLRYKETDEIFKGDTIVYVEWVRQVSKRYQNFIMNLWQLRKK